MDNKIGGKQLKDIKCSICKKKFSPDYYNQKYCSDECVKEAIKLSNEKRRAKYEEANKKKVEKDYDEMPNKVKLKCKTCKKEYEVYRSQIKFRGSKYCSIKCKQLGKISKTSQKKTVDKIWSEAVKEKAGHKCEYCGAIKYLNSHHIFSRSNHTTRWDIDNGICLCAKHHVLGNFSAHKAPLEFSEWIKEIRGEKWFNELLSKSRKMVATIDYAKIKLGLYEYRDSLKK